MGSISGTTQLVLLPQLCIIYCPALCVPTADTMIDAGQQYWEVRFDKESKAFAVGVALRSLGRFDQLGKSGASWCIHLNNWLQQSLTAKHNNKARTLDCPIPNSIGVFVNYEEGQNTRNMYQTTLETAFCGLENVLCLIDTVYDV